jgi:hypothetical protein
LPGELDRQVRAHTEERDDTFDTARESDGLTVDE